MNAATAWTEWSACTSALTLDRWLYGELPPSEAAELERHLAGCARCAAARAALAATRGEGLPPLRAGIASHPAAGKARPRPPGPRRSWRALAAAGVGAALAAGLVVALRPVPAPGPATALKGAGIGVAMYVRHGDEVRRATDGEVVAPGDAIRFAVTTPVPAHVAVLSLDPRRRGSIYFPLGPRAEAVEAGVEAALPLGTRLDDSVGEERIWVLFCPGPVELEPLRARLERAGELGAVPEGCGVSAWRFVKR